MPMSKEQIMAEAKTLEPKDREALAEALLLTLEGEDRAAIDAAWLAEARRRDAAFAAGEIKASPVDDVVARLLSRGRS